MLPSVGSWRRARPTARQLRTDLVVGALLVALGALTVEVLRSTPGGEQVAAAPWESHLWSLACVAPLMVRRLLPVTVMLVCSVAFYFTGERVPQVGYSVVVQVALFAAIYTAWAWSRRRRLLLAASVAVVVGMFAWLLQLIVEAEKVPGAEPVGLFPPDVAVAVMTLGINVVYFFGAIAWGTAAHRTARQRETLERRTEELRREQDLAARRAVVDERLRIARDLHDVVAHHVTGIGVQAAAARHVMDRDPAASREALRLIEGSSRDAVHEMHQLVGLLRAEEEPADPSTEATLGSLRRLADEAARPGLEVGYTEVGQRFAVPAAVARSAYRIVQEALTNVRRHSTARRAEVVLRYLDGRGSADGRAVEVEVVDDGTARAGAGRDGHERPGYGLQGIRERVELHRGEHEIGPRPDRGYRVRARLPVRGGA